MTVAGCAGSIVMKSMGARSRVFIDHGRGMPNGRPALLKRREYLRRDDMTPLEEIGSLGLGCH